MKDFTRLYAVTNGASGGWTRSTRTSFVLSVDDDQLTMKVKSGRDPYCEEINTAFGRFFQEYEAEYGAVELYQRAHRYRFTFQEGSSGRQTTFIEVDQSDGFPTRRRLLDRTCYGKCGGMSLFVYDFLDLCVTEGFFEVVGDNYRYAEEADAFGRKVEMKSVRPRLTQYESGWTYPGEHPDGVVSIYDAVRDEPAASDEPQPDEPAANDPTEEAEAEKAEADE